MQDVGCRIWTWREMVNSNWDCGVRGRGSKGSRVGGGECPPKLCWAAF